MWKVGVLCSITLLIILITHWFINSKNRSYKNGVLPPGSMGLPFIGETLQLLVPGRSLDVHPFFKKRIQWYGPIFRTNLFGNPMVVSADPEVNHFLYLQEGKSVEQCYDNISKIFGGDADTNINAFTASHRYFRGTVLKNFGIESLKGELLPKIEELVQETLCCWSKEESINVKTAVGKMVFNFMAKRMLSYDMAKDPEDLSETFVNVMHSLMTFPVNIPGTAYHDSLKKKNLLVNFIEKKMRERLNSPEAYQGDVLDQVIKDMKTEKVSEKFAVFFILGVLFASFETISTALTLAIKLLSEHPTTVDELRIEHEEIHKKRLHGAPLSWSEYKSMDFTLLVIYEVLRVGSFFPGALRKATKDIQLNDYIIPEGWMIMLAYSAQMLNADTYSDPLAFNPHRWKELASNVISKNFMPFGAGARQCSGAEYTKVFMSTFLHVLCTNYRWKKVKGGDVSRKPAMDFGDGIYISLSK